MPTAKKSKSKKVVKRSKPSAAKRPRASRIRASDKGMASNILYGCPDGRGKLRPWGASDLVRAYEIPFAAAYKIISLESDGRINGEKWYAGQIADIRDTAIRVGREKR